MVGGLRAQAGRRHEVRERREGQVAVERALDLVDDTVVAPSSAVLAALEQEPAQPAGRQRRQLERAGDEGGVGPQPVVDPVGGADLDPVGASGRPLIAIDECALGPPLVEPAPAEQRCVIAHSRWRGSRGSP